VAAERIPAGLTNENWRVTVDGVAHFVRIPGPATELLAVDRINERHNTRAAAPDLIRSLPSRYKVKP